jgi:hypothetical protein
VADLADNFEALQVTVSSTTPTEIPTTTRKPVVGIQIKALAANTGIIYVGKQNVTSLNGYPLAANESVFLPLDILASVRFLASVNNEKVACLVV